MPVNSWRAKRMTISAGVHRNPPRRTGMRVSAAEMKKEATR